MADEPTGPAKRSSQADKAIAKTDVGAEQRGDERISPARNETVSPAVTIVGIGASAGGVEALGRFFDIMPPDSGCAFVVVLHLDPKHESKMAHILRARTTMPVAQVRDGMPIAPDHVYVIAPDTDLRVREGELHVSRPTTPHGQRHPVDVLFASIAAERHERAIAIVLSGTGNNGTQGLKAIRAEGGMSLVQAPETAKFDGMPRSAIAADMADHILAPEAMPEALLGYISHGYTAATTVGEPAPPQKGEATLEQVLELLRARAGLDFGNYKRSTQRRRVHRRMGLRNIETLSDYLDELRTSPEEIQTLVADLMINVTGFFRDPEAWQVLAERVIAPLVAERESGASIRVWVSACSTGEEAYSVAMLVTEQAEAAGKRFEVKVFATDAQEDNLRKARDGIYPAAAVAGLSAEQLRRFFDKLDGSYQVTKELRDMVVFAAQNLLRDPPFSRLDIVTCRNFLIYLEQEAQRRVIALCHFALRRGGHLFLGNAETVGRHDDLFETVSKKWRIYRRVGPTRHDLIDYPQTRPPTEPHKPDVPPPLLQPEPAAPVAEMARRALLERFAPASVLIDRKGRVLYFHGATRDYLEQPSGEPTRDLLAMARDGLALKLRGAIRDALKDNRDVTVNARIREGRTGRSVTMTVSPLPAASAGGNLLVSFTPAPRESDQVQPAVREDTGEASSSERALQEELTTARAELRNTIEHLETANEELKASNEEATSMNEELQSTNEELETSKEELQSFNEELNTVNNQLQHEIGELERVTNDLNNLLAGSEMATLFLDDKLRIKWFAPATRELFDFVSSDIGRPIAHFARKFSDENLLPDAETVLKKLTTIEAEVPSDSGRWYLRRMLPYRTRDNRIAGVVATFSDITARRDSERALRTSEAQYRTLFNSIDEGFCIIEKTETGPGEPVDFRYVEVNPAFTRQSGIGNVVGKTIREVFPGESQEWFDTYDAVLKTGQSIRFERVLVTQGRVLDLYASRLDDSDTRLAVIFQDITERRRADEHRKALMGELNHRVKNTLAVIQSIASQTLGQAETMEEARAAFSARLVNLAKAHDVLTRESWVSANLAEIVADTVKPHAGGEDRFRIKGQDVQLSSGPALAIAMALHELGTNAAKYGALSTPQGYVDIVWEMKGTDDHRRLILHWQESGGPQVVPPKRKGFGSRLIERVLAAELRGEVRIEYEPSGVACTIDAPMPAGQDAVGEFGGQPDR